ncbi:hypothetical protein KDW61_27540 [Burkholderia cenocepacia]|uniref:hypothetical protein n=1 Tax=Burkholderia cenocepacia TaxID=95486 RepID=UPI001B9AAEF2|nr:hypothetical protein [Burkholderia cenocepacia]MBR8212423.1 hypothetical protein [Burkholderia cenocepacia]
MATKQVGIRIRVEKQLRDEFQSACLAENQCASEVLREFMRTYAQHHVGGLQASLFLSDNLYTPKESND